MSGPGPSARLSYRAWDPVADVDAAFAIYRDPDVTLHIGGFTVADRDAMADMLAKWDQATSAYPEPFDVWAAVHEGTPIGAALLKPLPILDGDRRELTDDIEVGWHLGKPWWGQGFATEMGEALLAYGFDTLGLSEIHCVIEAENTASVRVAERLKLTPRGTTDRWYGKALLHFSARRSRAQ